MDSPLRYLVEGAQKDPEHSHHLVTLNSGDHALLFRLNLIRDARKSIRIQTFAWMNDKIGSLLLRELIRAAKRGVRVEIVLDGWAVSRRPGFWSNLMGVNDSFGVRIYNPPGSELKPNLFKIISEVVSNFNSVNHRMHSKSFIVDDEVLIVGGRNYEDDYFNLGQTRNFKDREVLIVGPVVEQFIDSFTRFFDSKLSRNRSELIDLVAGPEESTFDPLPEISTFSDVFVPVLEQAYDDTLVKQLIDRHLYRVDSVQAVLDQPASSEPESGEDLDTNDTVVALTNLISGAKHSLIFQTPYFVLEDAHLNALRDLRSKCPDCEIIVSTNSLASTDNVLAYSLAFRERVIYLNELNIDLYEFKPHPGNMSVVLGYQPTDEQLSNERLPSDNIHLCIHAKTYVIDHEYTWIGSMNLDPRSARLNKECGIIIKDKRLSDSVANDIINDTCGLNSWAVAFSDRGYFTKMFRRLLHSLSPEIKGRPSPYMIFTENFEQDNGPSRVSQNDSRFYEYCKPVGTFPKVQRTSRDFSARFISTCLPFLKSIA